MFDREEECHISLRCIKKTNKQINKTNTHLLSLHFNGCFNFTNKGHQRDEHNYINIKVY